MLLVYAPPWSDAAAHATFKWLQQHSDASSGSTRGKITKAAALELLMMEEGEAVLSRIGHSMQDIGACRKHEAGR